MEKLQDIINISKELKSVNDFNEIVCTHYENDISIGSFLKLYWLPNNSNSFYDYDNFYSKNYQLLVDFCTDDLLVRLYKQSICLISQLRNIPIKSFPEDYQIVKEKLKIIDNHNKTPILNQKDIFYKFYTYKNITSIKTGINIFKLNHLIKTLNERGLSDKILMHPEDITNIFSATEILYSPDGENILFFSNIPTFGNKIELLDKYVDSFSEYVIKQENENNPYSKFSYPSPRSFLNDFSIMFKILNENKDENFKDITKKYLTTCSNFTEKYPGLISPKYCSFSKDLIRLKKQKQSFASSIFEQYITSKTDFKILDSKTVIVDIVSVLKYQRDKHTKAFEPKHIKSTLQKNVENLNTVILSSYDNIIYFTFFNTNKLDNTIFNQTIDNFMSFMLGEVLNPKRSFLNEYDNFINKAIMENDLLAISQKNNSQKVAKINKF